MYADERGDDKVFEVADRAQEIELHFADLWGRPYGLAGRRPADPRG
jgi:hypothetical protein